MVDLHTMRHFTRHSCPRPKRDSTKSLRRFPALELTMIMSWWSRNSRLLLVLLFTGWILLPSDASAQSSGVTRDIETEYNKSVVRILTTGRDVQGRPKAEYGTGIFVSEG